MRNDVLAAIAREKIILVVRGLSGEELFRAADACLAGGICLLEVPFCADKSTGDAEIAACIRALRERYAGRMHVGAGTVLTAAEAELAAAAGAEFLVSPVADPAVIRRTRELGLVSVPGAMTPSEVCAAHTAGADFVKIFPAAQVGGPAYFQSLRGPFPHVKTVAFGGVTAAEIPAYLRAGAAGVGIASEILDKKLLAAGDYAAITARARACVQAAQGEQT